MEGVVLSGVRALLVSDRAILKVDLGRPALAVGVLANAVAGAPGVDNGGILGEVYVIAEKVVLMYCVVARGTKRGGLGARWEGWRSSFVCPCRIVQGKLRNNNSRRYAYCWNDAAYTENPTLTLTCMYIFLNLQLQFATSVRHD